MRQITNAIVAGLILVTTIVGNGTAASTYDGKWIGTAPNAGDCGVLTVTLIITSGSITGGTVSGQHGSPAILPAVIAPDGIANLKYAQCQATARLTGTQFTGNFQTVCGTRAVTGAKTP